MDPISCYEYAITGTVHITMYILGLGITRKINTAIYYYIFTNILKYIVINRGKLFFNIFIEHIWALFTVYITQCHCTVLPCYLWKEVHFRVFMRSSDPVILKNP